MTPESVIYIGAIALLFSLVLVVLAWHRTGRMPAYESREEALAKRVSDLEEALIEAERRRIEREAELERDIQALTRMLLAKEHQVSKLTERIRQLEQSVPAPSRRQKQALLIAYTAQKMLEEDLAALRGVTAFQRDVLKNATMAKLKMLIDERRGMGDPVRNVHLAMHAGPNGVAFEDGVADGLWLSQALAGVDVLVIAGCQSTRQAYLIGVVPNVVSMRDDADSASARIFSRAFWEAIGDGKDPEDAFYEARNRSPVQMDEMVAFHKYHK